MSEFTTAIPRGNIFEMLGTATRFLRQLSVPQEDIDALRVAVMSSKSYEEACGHIAKWFPLK